MSKDHISEIDSILAESLPDLEQDSDVTISKKKQEDMIQILQYSAEELGKSPTIREFKNLNLDVTADIIVNTFGTWNEAKEAAGLETDQRRTIRDINETYFQSIDSPEKAYWLGTLVANSSLQSQPTGGNYALQIGRSEYKEYFVTEFADAVESGYSISRQQQNKSDKQIVQLQLSNPTFIEFLLDAGYPGPNDEQGGFSVIDDEYRSSFLQGFLESSGYFTTNGWQIPVDDLQRGETLQEWFEQYGAKRPTVSQVSSGDTFVRVSNPFDIKAIFESLWPDILETEPCWKPYPRKILQYLNSEYPYPENLSYLDG
ncbi:homing endonuclease associated repeat-containing protein [Natronorubrum thiooxidans]|uniref:Uncharacterized protein n=1 Tax=Natronorubrum thiooxidans TaxID=308853 RepID=A0A1N7GUC3_9EURY|nr:hypothetical protein [Natronorubrum thiooxidans]SIS16175.1 hypothetical protein SAMN05421752_115102 [Natronorubrum thiooxidans]